MVELIFIEWVFFYVLIMLVLGASIFGAQFLLINWEIKKYEAEWYKNKYDRQLKILNSKLEKLEQWRK